MELILKLNCAKLALTHRLSVVAPQRDQISHLLAKYGVRI